MKPESKEIQFDIRKSDEDQRLATGIIYAPGIIDSHGDIMSAKQIAKMAYNFMANNRNHMIDVSHDNKLYGCYLVESFIAREDDSLFIPGSWVGTVYIPDDELWQQVKNGELNGFSMQVLTYKREIEVEVELPLVLKGQTLKMDSGHTHEYTVIINEDGAFAGGRTNEVNGHWHEIRKGSVTEEADGHKHKFCYPDVIIELEADIKFDD